MRAASTRIDPVPQPLHAPLRSFGRLKARPIKARQAALLETLLPTLALDLAGPLNFQTLMPGAREVWLEIGFGGGEHLAAQAGAHPDTLMLGAEPFLNGAASALRHISEAHLQNVRLHIGDARDLLSSTPDAALQRVFILFPDPWPKARHHKRRLIQPEVAADIGRVLAPGGGLRFATDWADYANGALQILRAEPRLQWCAGRADDWRVAPADHVATRYQAKALGDIAPVFLEFVRRP